MKLNSIESPTLCRAAQSTQIAVGSRSAAKRPLAGTIAASLALALTVGCGSSDRAEPLADDSVEREVELAFQSVDAQLGIPAAAGSAARSTASGPSTDSSREARPTTQLARFAARGGDSVRWEGAGFRTDEGAETPASASAQAVELIQAATKPSSRAQRRDDNASTAGPIESAPTPQGQREARGGAIPTPPGKPVEADKPVAPAAPGKPAGPKPVQPNQPKLEIPEPAARIAAEPDKTGDSPKAEPTVQTDSSTVQAAGQPALINPNREDSAGDAATGPEDYTTWPQPDVTLFVTGDQHGYIEPCGCTGLENQKGGVARRFTFLNQLRQRNWDVVPVDAGNQIRRIGKQAAIKFEKSAGALSQMQYEAVGFGPGDMNLSVGELIATTYPDSPENAMFVSANIVLIDPEFLPTHKIVRQGDWKIGLSSILDPEALEAPVGSDVTIHPIRISAEKVLAEMNTAGANFRVLTFFGEEEVAKQLMADVPGFDLIVVSGGYGEPTYRPQPIDGSDAKMIVTGNKGMYVGLVGLYQDRPMKYARVALTHDFEDAPEMRKLMADYQKQLEQLGLTGLGLSPTPHLSGHKFVGTEACAKCHTSAYDVWQYTAHVDATKHIVEPTEGRGDVPRHFDPECLSCHVTGWDPQGYKPYETGYWSLADSSHLTGNGCENCHGPGSAHVAAEQEDSGVSEEEKLKFRLQMQLPLEKAKEHCMKCHDLDNSPDFHEEGAFEDEYWPQVEHYGVD